MWHNSWGVCNYQKIWFILVAAMTGAIAHLLSGGTIVAALDLLQEKGLTPKQIKVVSFNMILHFLSLNIFLSFAK